MSDMQVITQESPSSSSARGSSSDKYFSTSKSRERDLDDWEHVSAPSSSSMYVSLWEIKWLTLIRWQESQ